MNYDISEYVYAAYVARGSFKIISWPFESRVRFRSSRDFDGKQRHPRRTSIYTNETWNKGGSRKSDWRIVAKLLISFTLFPIYAASSSAEGD